MATQKGIKKGSISILFIAVLLLGFTHLSAVAQIDDSLPQISEKAQEEMKEADLNAGEIIIGHIVDSYEWHIADWGHTHLTIPLPVILFDQGEWHFFSSSKFHHGKEAYKGFEIASEGVRKGKIVRKDANGELVQPIDLSLTKNSLAVLIYSFIVILIFLSVAKAYRKRERHAPKGLQSIIEPLILFIRDDIARPSIGNKHYERFLPHLLTLFFFIFLNNLFGLIPIFPFGANVTGSIAVTAVLALFTFVITTISGNKNYYAHIFNTPNVPWWLKLPVPLMPIIELLGVFTKPFVLMIRLFANITAGHSIILGFISLIFVFGQTSLYAGLGISVISVVMSIFINLLELLVAFIQAYVFTLLSAIYFGMAVEEHH